MGIKDDINRILRDHEGYTGDGRGGVGDLPIGDRSTARKPISKRDLREVLGAVHDSVADPADAAMQAAEDAIDAAERAELAASGVEYPVSYAAQTLTAPQQAQARDNIGAADSATAVVNTRTITAGAGLTGGGDLTADRTLAADFATEGEALAGTATDKVMSPARVRDAMTWRQVAHVPVTATAAVTLTGLDYDSEMLILLSGLSPNAGANTWLTIARSTDNGATWDAAFRYSVTADWVADSLLGSFLMRKTTDGFVYLDGRTNAATLATASTIYQTTLAPATFSATTNALRFAWSGAGRDFAAGGYITVLKRG